MLSQQNHTAVHQRGLEETCNVVLRCRCTLHLLDTLRDNFEACTEFSHLTPVPLYNSGACHDLFIQE